MDVFIKSFLHFANIMTGNILHACRVVLGQRKEGLLLKELLFFLLLETRFEGGHTDVEYKRKELKLKEKESQERKKKT